MRYRPVKNIIKVSRPAVRPAPPLPKPPQMDNPYARYFTQPRTLESLRKKRD